MPLRTRDYERKFWCGGHGVDDMPDRASVAVQPGGTGGLSRAEQHAKGATRLTCAEELSALIVSYVRCAQAASASSRWCEVPFLNGAGAEEAKAKLKILAERLSHADRRRESPDRAPTLTAGGSRSRSRSRSPRL